MKYTNVRSVIALCCALGLAPGEALLMAADTPAPPAAPAPDASAKLPPEQLDALVAPIALYPDPLLAQTLVAATYPLELIQLQQWLAKNPKLKDKELADAVAKQPWDPSIQSMAATPEVVKRLSDDVQWTTDLGNAFLAQQSDVMDACQRMRKKAQDNGALKTNEQQKVETQTVEQKTVIVVQQANPEVIYVPSYSPVVVYGPPIYPYPPIYYPPYPPGAAFVSFSVGVMVGAAFWGGSCCGCGWGHSSNVNINVNNNFNKNTNINTGNRPGGSGGNNWQHNPQHRGAAPYGDKGTANKYGGSTKGGGAGAGNRGASPSTGAAGNRGGGSPSAGNMSSGAGAGNRGGGSPSAGTRPSGGAGGGGDKVGNRSIPSGGSSSKAGGFGGGSSGFSGSSAKASSSRGASSMGSRGGGGGGGRRR